MRVIIKKKAVIISILVIIIILLIPIKYRLKDGGSIEYKSIIYKITKVHMINENSKTGYDDGLIIELFGYQVFNKVNISSNCLLISNSNLNMDSIVDNILVKYNNNLYSKSYSVIDYLKNPNGPVGKIDKLISKECVPSLNGETNSIKLLNALVEAAGEEGLILNYDNEYVLFDRVKSNFKIIDKSKNIEDFVCASSLEKIYEDSSFVYYLPCIKSNYIVVRYDNGNEELITTALEKGNITIKDLDQFEISYIEMSVTEE